MPRATRSVASISSVAIRTTARCRWTTSCGWQRGRPQLCYRYWVQRRSSESAKADVLRCPVEALAAFDIDANEVEDVILTHLHYDHAGNFDRFLRARFHLQEREPAYATGRFMRYPRLSHSFEVEDICGIVRLNYARRVLFYVGDTELAPGLTIHAAGGHSAGLQFVRIRTHRGFVVLASDVSHFYENMASEVRLRPLSISAKCWRDSTGCWRLRRTRVISF